MPVSQFRNPRSYGDSERVACSKDARRALCNEHHLLHAPRFNIHQQSMEREMEPALGPKNLGPFEPRGALRGAFAD